MTANFYVFWYRSFFVLALAARVYPRCTLGRLTLFNKLTYQKKCFLVQIRIYVEYYIADAKFYD